MRVITNEKKAGIKYVVSKWAVDKGIENIKKGIDQIVNTKAWDTNQKGVIQTPVYQPPDE